MDAIRMMWRMVRSDQRGATAIEYGLIAALICVACLVGFSALGGGVGGLWGRIGTRVGEALS